MRLLRAQLVVHTRLKAMRREDAVPAYLLIKLSDTDGRRASDLAAEVGADPSTVSRQVAVLVREGLVTRQADPADGRASILVLTESGVQRRDELLARREELFESVTDDWSDADRTIFAGLLRRYVASLENHRERIIAGLGDSMHTPSVSSVSSVSSASSVPAAPPAADLPTDGPAAAHPTPRFEAPESTASAGSAEPAPSVRTSTAATTQSDAPASRSGSVVPEYADSADSVSAPSASASSVAPESGTSTDSRSEHSDSEPSVSAPSVSAPSVSAPSPLKGIA